MKQNNFMTVLKQSLFTILSVTALIGCGGGGGGGGGSSISPYITVASVTPNINATEVDARLESITAVLSADVDPTVFVSKGQALGKLLSAKGIKLQNVQTNTAVDPNGLTLAELSSGKYLMNVKVGSTDQMAVAESYQFVEDANGSYGLSIKLLNVAQTIDFTSAELLTSGVINSDLFKVSNGSTPAYGQITVSGRTLTFHPINYLKWSSEYTVTLSTAIKDTTNRPLQNNYTWSFKTMNMPTPAIENVSPIGIGANAIKKIYAKPNFEVSPGSLTYGAVVLNKLIKVDATQPAQKQQVDISLNYNKGTGNIEITPSSPLDYLQEYEVIVKGATGISGSFGSVGGVRLANDYVWTFTTAEPKVVSYTPVVANSTSPEVERDAKISVELNFHPNTSTITSGLILTNAQNTVVPYDFTVADGTVTIVPKNLLNYSTLYNVTVTPALKAAGNNSISVANATTFSFTTVVRRLISWDPYDTQTGVSANGSIKLGFNFDVAPNVFTPANYMNYVTVEQQTNQGSWVRVPVTVYYNVDTRVAELSPTTDFLFNALVRVTLAGNVPSADGATIAGGAQWSFTVKNENLALSASTPYSGSSNVQLNTEISARLSYQIDAASFSSSSALEVKDCSGRKISGRSTLDGSTLYFLPYETLESNCLHTVTVSSSIRGVRNEKQNSTIAFTFTTEGLSVKNVYVTYAYSDFVDVSSPIEIQFSHPVSYVYSSDIYLENSRGSRVSGNLYRFGNKVEFSPYYTLEYGEEYKLVVTTNVKGTNGEKLKTSDTTYFYTENIPLDVVDYGPTGLVYVDDQFWVDMSHSVSTNGFPSYTGRISPYVYTSVRNDNNYLIYMTPSSNLNYNTSYNIEFDFSFNRGSFYDSFKFSWNVTTESNNITEKAYKKSVQTRESRSCRNNMDCVGSLKPRNLQEYKKSLAAKKEVNIKPAAVQERLKAKRAAKLRGN